jgi:hypothetical protein
MARLSIEDKYFEWMYDLMCEDDYDDEYSYRELFSYLHSVEFVYTISRDANRANDGIDLRYRFSWDTGYPCADSELDGPCSVLEMMIALAIRCEETIMDDPAIGDRTSQWFWKMIVNLGLGDMIDSRFDKIYVEDVITKFLNREFEPDGRGGLFTIWNCDYDLRDIEIWTILCWYLNSIS